VVDMGKIIDLEVETIARLFSQQISMLPLDRKIQQARRARI